MNAFDLLARLTQQGVQLWINKDKLSLCSPKGVMTPELRMELAAHKKELLAFLREIDIETLAQHLAEEAEFDVSEADIMEI